VLRSQQFGILQLPAILSSFAWTGPACDKIIITMGSIDVKTTTPWQDIVAEKQRAAKKLVPPAWLLPDALWEELTLPLEANSTRLIEQDFPRRSGLLTTRELEITENYSTAQLLSGLTKGVLSSLEVTTAFCKRAAIAQQLTNCLTEVFYDAALIRAKELDDYLAANGKPSGPLHGLPISVKDSFKVKGIDSSIGFVSLLNKPAQQNSPLIDILLELGAVLYVKTNIPQTMMTADSHNNVWGRTLNPHNSALTAGGSTGGEGALIAFRGSPLGIGTDVAGSIRIPSFCCGIYGFKPTSGRIPFGGQQSPVLEGFSPIVPSAGPIANSFAALQLLSEAVLSAHPARHDTTSLDVPWQNLAPLPSSARLNIGVLTEDASLPLYPPVKRAMNNASALLADKGHNLISIGPEKSHIASLSELSLALFTLDIKDGVEFITSSGEPVVPSVAAGAAPVRGDTLKAFWADFDQMDMFRKVAALGRERHRLSEAWRKLWNEMKLDAIICPGAQHTAVKHDTFQYPAYTVFLNVLDVSHISPQDDPPSPSHPCALVITLLSFHNC
jgi:amidase